MQTNRGMSTLDDLDISLGEDTFAGIETSLYSPTTRVLPTSPALSEIKPHLLSNFDDLSAIEVKPLFICQEEISNPPSNYLKSESPCLDKFETSLPLFGSGVENTLPDIKTLMNSPHQTDNALERRKRGRPRKCKNLEDSVGSPSTSIHHEESLPGVSSTTKTADLEAERAAKTEIRKERRRASNRRAARKCRDRKKSEAEQQCKEREDMQKEIDSLNSEKLQLQEQLVDTRKELDELKAQCGIIQASVSPVPHYAANTSYHYTPPHDVTLTQFTGSTPPLPSVAEIGHFNPAGPDSVTGVQAQVVSMSSDLIEDIELPGNSQGFGIQGEGFESLANTNTDDPFPENFYLFQL